MVLWFIWGLLGAVLIALEHYIYTVKKGQSTHFTTDECALIFLMIPCGPIGLSIGLVCLVGVLKLENMAKPYKDSQWL